MASDTKGNSIREILNRGIFLSLVLSLLVGSGVVIVWQYVSQVRANDYNVRVIREALQRDAADLLTSAMLKNYEAVGFQLKTALASLPLGCAYIDLQGQRYAVKGDSKSCAAAFDNSDGIYREQISSGGMTIGPLVYTLESQSLPSGTAMPLILAFVALVGCVVLTWGVLIKMINDAILRPLGGLSAHLTEAEYSADPRVTCDEVVSLARRLQSFRSQVSTSAKREEFVRVARMIAHNIDTPVLVLEGVDASNLDDRNRAIYRDALSDIKGLVANLRSEASAMKQSEALTSKGDQYPTPILSNAPTLTPGEHSEYEAKLRPENDALTVEHVMGLVEMAVSEKRLQSKTPYEIVLEPSSAAYLAFARVQRTELKCILLNLLNNAVESLSGASKASGQIHVRVAAIGGRVLISVSDDGPGVEPMALPRLGEQGFSMKEDGSGLGLYHAKTMAAAWGGSFRIESQLGEGACVTIEVPAAPAPDWFTDEIRISGGTQIAVLDDDPKIGHVWEVIMAKAHVARSQFFTFTHAKDFKAWVQQHKDSDILCLVDYELTGQDQNGLGVIEELGISECAILVTGRYDDAAVQKNVRWLGTRMIPKPLLGAIPIRTEGSPGLTQEQVRDKGDNQRVSTAFTESPNEMV